MTDIAGIMKRYGRMVEIVGENDERSEPFGAFIQPLRYKNKMYLGGVNTRVGFNREGYYLYLGPPGADLTALGRGARIVASETEAYTVDRAEKVYAGDSVSHIWAIVRSVVEV